MNQDIQKLFIEFLLKMQVNLNNPRIEQYLFNLSGFDYQCIKEVLDLWSKEHVHRFIPSPNELLELLIKQNKQIDTRSGPRTVKDLFGNKVRIQTPLSRELRKIMLQLVNEEITREQADELVLEAEKKYGFIDEPIVPFRKTPEQCIYDSGVNESEVKRAFNKQHKDGEDRRVLNDLARALIPWGHTLFRAHEKLEFLSMDDDAWREEFDVLVGYGK